MEWKAVIGARLADLGLDAAREAEIVEELTQHFDDRHAELRAMGLTADEAARVVLAELHEELTDRGLRQDLRALTARADEHPVVPGSPGVMTMPIPMIRTVWQDVRYGVRMMRQAPGFTLVALITLALGIGANAAIFSVINGVMLRPLPYPDSDRLMILSEITRAGRGMSVAWPNFQDWRDQQRVFEHFGLYRNQAITLTGGDQPLRVNGSLISSGAINALGVPPLMGRAFGAADDAAGAARVALVSERVWRTQFNADPSLVGRAITLNGEPHTVVGIMPPDMRFPGRATDVWLALGPFVETFPARGSHPGLTVLAKLKAGATVDQARAEMDTIARRLTALYPQSNPDSTVSVTPYYEQIVGFIRPTLQVLIGAVAFVLLIGCTNLANLMLVKAEARQRELAIRASLGAARRRLLQQLMTESLLLALIGGVLGTLLATWAVRAFVASRPSIVPRIDLIGVDRTVLAFVAVISIATAIIFGLLPALRASSPDLLTTLKDASRGTSASGRRMRSGLLIVEVALAFVLLVGAGLAIQSFARLMSVDPGFRTERVVTMRTTLPAAKFPNRARWTVFYEAVLQRVRELPGIEAAAVNSAIPLEGGGSESMVMAEGAALPTEGGPRIMALFQVGSPEYFRAMGIQLVRGRTFTDRDTLESTRVAVVDETLVTTMFPNQEAIGKRLAFEIRPPRPGQPSAEAGTAHGRPEPMWREIVGVVRHVRHYGLGTEPPFVQLYVPLRQPPTYYEQRPPSLALIVRTAQEPDAVAASIRAAVAAVDRDIPVHDVQLLREYVSRNAEQPRLSALLLGGFGAIALILAMVGIYGVMSYSVAQRTQEMGIRLALGASRGDVLRLVVGHGVLLATVGIVIGAGASWALTRWMRALFVQLSAGDWTTVAGIALLLAAVAFLASYLPARRATRIDPVTALRAE